MVNTDKTNDKKCSQCLEFKPLTEYYKARKVLTGIPYLDYQNKCKACWNIYQSNRWIKKKIRAIIHMGSKCEDCALHLKDSHHSVFEFHHLDPNEKDFDWRKMRKLGIKRIIEELKKCVLLCANCHRVRHASDDMLIKEILKLPEAERGLMALI